MPQQHKLKACERAHHEHFAVSEMQQAQHAKDEGVADGDQGVGAAEHHPVDELLQEHWVLPTKPLPTRPWLTVAWAGGCVYCATTKSPPLISSTAGIRVPSPFLSVVGEPLSGASELFMLDQQSRSLTRSALILVPSTPVLLMHSRIR